MSDDIIKPSHDRNIARAITFRLLSKVNTDITAHELYKIIRAYMNSRIPESTLINLSTDWWFGVIVPVLMECGWQRYPHATERWYKSPSVIRLERKARELESAMTQPGKEQHDNEHVNGS